MANSTLDLDLALTLAQRAGEAGNRVLLDHFGRLKNVREKHLAGLVSEADLQSENEIKKILSPEFSDIKFLGEESGQDLENWSQTGNWWIVDPLDGTTNYVHGLPIFCVSIGLMWGGEMVLALVTVPKLGLTYTALKGRGAKVNGVPIKVSQRADVQESLLATGFFRDQPVALEEQIKIFTQLIHEARGIRRAGAAAYDLCLVAEGVYEAFWEKNLKPWDTAAGILLVQEAGGRVSDYQGQPYRFSGPGLVASNGAIHSTILSAISKVK